MKRALQTQVTVIGGGPAGMAAARELARAGVSAAIVDEGLALGGQIFRQRGKRTAAGRDEPPGHGAGRQLIEEVLGSERIDVIERATVFDLRPDLVLAERDGEAVRIDTKRIILATGAVDRPLPFPGWTLPGVMTAGAAQVFLRGQVLFPGKRIVIAGTGPLLLPVATALAGAGCEIVALLEANRIGGVLRQVPRLLLDGKRRREALYYLRRLSVAGVRIKRGWAVLSAHGVDTLKQVCIGRIDRDGYVIGGTERELEVDLLCVGFGLMPTVELAQHLRCAMHHRALRGGWLPVHDENMQTSVPGVYVAGETAGVGGAEVALAEGALAGRAVAADLLGAGPDAAELRALRGRCRRERRFSDALLSAFPVPAGLYHLAQPDTVVCRCEDVTLREIEAARGIHGSGMRAAKMATRAGMGPCQARICHQVLGEILLERGLSRERPVPCRSVRPPLRPVSVRTMLEGLGLETAAPEEAGQG